MKAGFNTLKPPRALQRPATATGINGGPKPELLISAQAATVTTATGQEAALRAEFAQIPAIRTVVSLTRSTAPSTQAHVAQPPQPSSGSGGPAVVNGQAPSLDTQGVKALLNIIATQMHRRVAPAGTALHLGSPTDTRLIEGSKLPGAQRSADAIPAGLRNSLPAPLAKARAGAALVSTTLSKTAPTSWPRCCRDNGALLAAIGAKEDAGFAGLAQSTLLPTLFPHPCQVAPHQWSPRLPPQLGRWWVQRRNHCRPLVT